MGESLRERLLRLVVFLFCVIILAICLGVLLSQLHMPVAIARKVAIFATTLAAIVSYLAAYKPGWIYKSLVDAAKKD